MFCFNQISILAQAAGAGSEGTAASGGIGSMVVMMIGTFGLMYFAVIRPQRLKAKEHEKLVSALKVGDKVVINSSIHGIISSVKEKTFVVKIADNTKIEVEKASVTDRPNSEAPAKTS